MLYNIKIYIFVLFLVVFNNKKTYQMAGFFAFL